MLLNYILDITPFVFAFGVPTMPQVAAPVSPMNSVDAERKRMDASDAAMKAATLGGRSSTIRGGNDVAYAKQAGRDLMSGSASRSMGL